MLLTTYAPQTLKCPILVTHHILINNCIYLGGITFICDAGTINLSDILSVRNCYIPTTIAQGALSPGWDARETLY